MQKDNAELRQNLVPWFLRRGDFFSQEVANSLASLFINSHAGVRGHWTPGGLEYVSGGAGELINEAVPTKNLSFYNNPLLYPWDGVRMYMRFNGSSHCLYSQDAYHWSVTGGEVKMYSSYRGLALGAWCYFDTTASDHEYIISKRRTSDQLSYSLKRDPNGYALFDVSGTGSSMIEITSSPDTIPATTWTFITGSYDPSTSLTLRVNDTEYTNTTSIPSSIYSGSAEFVIGARDNNPLGYAYWYDGVMAHPFIFGSVLSSRAHHYLFGLTRANYGA